MARRTHLSFTQKRALQAHHRENAGLTQADLSQWALAEFGVRVARSTISKILNENVPATLNPRAKRQQKGRYAAVEAALYQFVLKTQGNVTLTDLILRQKANELLEEAGISTSLSLSWVTKFKARHGIKGHRARIASNDNEESEDSGGEHEHHDGSSEVAEAETHTDTVLSPVATADGPRQMQRILVAGGAGFIGIHLCTRLLELGHEVLCLDSLFTSQRVNVLHLMRTYPNFEFIRHDVTQPYSCEVDQIYNLACPASPVHYQYNPIKTTKVSFLGAINLLGLAKRLKARIFQASTSEVYGDPEVTPQREDYHGRVDCTGVRACYDEGKRVAETLFFEYHRTHNVDIRVARIFNTYGPGMHPYDGRVVSNFIMQALRGEDITIYGTGRQTRSFCYVEDLVDAIVLFMECSTSVGPMNLGNPFEMTILQLAQMIIRLTGSSSKLVFRDLPNDDPRRRQPDISLAQEHLNWTPSVGIEDGLKRTIDFFRTLDLSKFKRPTNHTAHRSSQRMNG